jgi:hypothetical protein
MRLLRHLEDRFPNQGRLPIIRAEMQRVCEGFIRSGFADAQFEAELTNGSDGAFWSRASEALIYDRIKDLGLSHPPRTGAGPDFLLTIGTQRVWIEVVCPQPSGLDEKWLDCRMTEAGRVPHEEILLRWTSAIKEKSEKLLGNPTKSAAGYLKTGLVAPHDTYVIAVNGCQMRNGPFPSMNGVSRFPYAAEAVLPIGPYQLHFDKTTLKKVGEGHQLRFHLPKPNGSEVSTGLFLDSSYGMVSAIWAVDFNGHRAIGNPEPSCLIHNPLAVNPLPHGLLPADQDYVAVPMEDGYNFGPI